MKTFLIVDFLLSLAVRFAVRKASTLYKCTIMVFGKEVIVKMPIGILESGEDFYFNVKTRLSVLPNYNFLL